MQPNDKPAMCNITLITSTILCADIDTLAMCIYVSHVHVETLESVLLKHRSAASTVKLLYISPTLSEHIRIYDV